jgi:Flp pilus assembly protein CpaB
VILLAAVGLGLVSAFLLYQYIEGIRDDERSNIVAVPVFKAVEPIPRGTLGDSVIDNGLIEDSEIAREFLPGGAITNSEVIRGQVAVFDIPQRTALSNDMFVAPSAAEDTFRRRLLEPNWVTVTVSVDEVRGVGGFIVPGDEVNIMVLSDVEAEVETAAIDGAGAEDYFIPPSHAQHLYLRVHVLAVGRITQRQPGDTADAEEDLGNTGLITFNVPPEAAQNIATWGPAVYLSLVPDDYDPSAVEAPPLVWVAEDFPAQGAGLTPYGADGDGRGE